MRKRVLAAILLASFILPQVRVEATDNEYKKIITTDKVLVKEENPNRLVPRARMSTFNIEEVREVTKEYETLVKKTDSNFEIALAKSDMSYTYVDKADSYEEAVVKADKLRSNDVSITPTVINKEGVVAYATESIGRLWRKYTNDEAKKETNSYFYSEKELKNAYTYINDGYMSEAPLIENNEREAKVLISGYEGWLNKDINRYGTTSSRDLEIVPISQVTNPCYYFVEGGILYHRITTSLDNAEASNSTPMVGVAPSYLKAGVKYSSYDGMYFYTGSDIRDGLTILTKDLRNGNHNSAVNSNDPYYAYYKYLPFRTKTNYTANEIDNFIEGELNRLIANNNNSIYANSKLRGIGQTIINAQNKYGVNGLLMLGVAINESGWGISKNALNKNNLFGLNAQDNRPGDASIFTSVEDCVTDFARNYISRGYADPSNFTYYGGFLGGKDVGANVKYAADPYWADKGANYAFLADYRMAGNVFSKMKDYNYYQLAMYTETNTMTDLSGNSLYNIATAPKTNNSSHIGSVVPLLYKSIDNINGKACYETYPERTNSVTTGRFGGEYNWDRLGYFEAKGFKIINTGKNYYYKEDFNKSGTVEAIDLAQVADRYNMVKGATSWEDKYDTNRDGVVDIYDLIRTSNKIKV